MNHRDSYAGKPFIGLQTTTSVDDSSRKPLRTYCLLTPTTESQLGGMHGIPIGATDPDHPFFGGIQGLAALVVQNYGPHYEDKTTFKPPEPERIGSDKGWYMVRYEPLKRGERKELRAAADRWIKSRRK